MSGFFSSFTDSLPAHPWLLHQLSLIVFLLAIAAIALANAVTLRRMRLGCYPRPPAFPRLSVLVPARNEEQTVGACVRSLLAQEYPDFEVIVLDDHSTDRTWAVLQEFRSDPRLKLVQGAALPAGWFGKHWACHQLFALADGDLVLFTDADTVHHPQTLRDAAAASLALDADLLTALPRERADRFGEKLIIPVLPFAVLGFLPLALAHRVGRPAYSATVGQFMMFRRSVLAQVGGYAAVRQRQVDDMALGRLIIERGFRWRFVDGQDRVSCRMYDGFRRSFAGFGNTIFAAFDRNLPLFLFVWLWLFVLFWEPLAVIGARLLGAPVSGVSLGLAIGAVAASLGLWMGVLARFRFPVALAPLYPVTFLLTLAMAVTAIIRYYSGRVVWKGRRLSPSGVPPRTSS